MATTLVLGCRPTLANVEGEVTAVTDAAPNAELLLDPNPALVAAKAPNHTWCHFAGHADPKLGPARVLVLCDASGFAAVDVSTLVAMFRLMKLVVLNGCKSVELGIKLRQAGVPNVVAWTTTLFDAAAKLFAVKFWQMMVGHADDDEDALRKAVRKAFESAKLAVQTAVKPGGAIDVGNGRMRAASVPKYELHDPEDAATVVQTGPGRGTLLPAAGAEKAGRNAAGVPVCLQICALRGVPNLPEQYKSRPALEAAHRNALLRTTHMMAITATTTGVSGPAGAGKSTTAAVLARDPLVHDHFPDGVTWLKFGRERTGADVLRTLATILRLDPALPHEQLPGAISAVLAGQRRLLVLDDIWTKEQLQAFASLAAEGGLLGRLVTTRSNELAGEHAQTVEALQAEEGLRVFAGYVGTAVEQLNDDADKLVDMCSGNPAMLRSVAAFCKKKGAANTCTYLEQCRQKMHHAKLPDAGQQYGTLFDALAGSLDHLESELAERCTMLATFPEDTDVPWSVVGQLWGTDALETEEALTELESWHLIDVDWDKCTLSLIDLHLDYLRARAKDDLARWHAVLLRGCRRRRLGDNEGSADDAYWGKSSAGGLHHLRGCGWEPTALAGELTHLTISTGYEGLGDEDVKALSEAIKANGSLTSLDLHANHIGDEGCKAVAEALVVNVSLTELVLCGNNIGDAGAFAIAKALEINGSLTILELGSNKICDEGAKAIGAALAVNGSLTTLMLYRNTIGNAVLTIADALRVNGSLLSLSLSNSTVNPVYQALLKDAAHARLRLHFSKS